jgi:hypothetical protein
MDVSIAEMEAAPQSEGKWLGKEVAKGCIRLDTNPRHAGAGAENISSTVEEEKMNAKTLRRQGNAERREEGILLFQWHGRLARAEKLPMGCKPMPHEAEEISS